MKTKQHIIHLHSLFLCGLLIVLSLQVQAQKQARPPQETVPPTNTFKVLTANPVRGKVVKGAPYSATATTETMQTLNDGNQIIRKNETKLYRDSEGRTRTEQTLETIGKWAANRKAQQIITIHDPVAGVSYSLSPDMRTAYLVIAPPQKAAPTPQNEGNSKPVKIPPASTPEAKGVKAKGGEPLGKRIMEGIEVEGVRVTNTIPAGEIGNVKPIEIVEETWYSPALQIVVLRTRRDPRSGETIYRLTNFSRSEPDHALFEVPADYNVSTNKVPTKSKSPKEE